MLLTIKYLSGHRNPLQLRFHGRLILVSEEEYTSYLSDLSIDGGESNSSFTTTVLTVAHQIVKISGNFVSTEATYCDERVQGQFLEFSDLPGLFETRYGAIPSQILVRNSYKILYARVTKIMHDEKRRTATLFTGIPGIGKSLFLLYFIICFIDDESFPDKRFAIEFCPGEYHYFEPTGTQGEFQCRSVNNDDLPLHEILLLSDIIEPQLPKNRARWTFIFSSPNPKRYKELLKYEPRYKYTLPTWSVTELLLVNPNIEDWYDSFVLFGGVPRHVLWSKQGFSPADQLEEAMQNKGGQIATAFFEDGFGNTDDELSYMLMHVNPPWSPEQQDWLYEKHVEHSFASDEIFQKIARKHENRLLAEPIDSFNCGATVASSTYGGGSAGKLFEMICLWLKPIEYKTITARMLVGGSKVGPFVMPKISLLSYHWTTDQLQPNKLYQPRISNLESGNAFCLLPIDGGLYDLIVLQITVGESHPVEANGLNKIVSAFPEELRMRMHNKFLMFVNPVDGKLNKPQPLHTQEEKEMSAAHIPTFARNFVQCVYYHKV